MEFITEFLPLIMFAVVFALLLLGFPVALTIGGVALAFGLYGFGPGFFAPENLGNHGKLLPYGRAPVYLHGGHAGKIRPG